jgi:hypothetical protein
LLALKERGYLYLTNLRVVTNRVSVDVHRQLFNWPPTMFTETFADLILGSIVELHDGGGF